MYKSSLPYNGSVAYMGVGCETDETSLYPTDNIMYHTAIDSGIHNIDPSLCALDQSVPSDSSSSPTLSDQAPPSTFLTWGGIDLLQHNSISVTPSTVSDDCIVLQNSTMASRSPSSFEYGCLNSTANSSPHSPCVDSDPYNDNDTMPSTPEDQGLFASASSSVGVYGSHSRLSPQPALLLLTGQHFLSDSTNIADRDFGDCQVYLNSNSCMPTYNPNDRGYTLLSSSSCDETEIQQSQPQSYYNTYPMPLHTTPAVYASPGYPIQRTLSPELMQAESIQVLPIHLKHRELKPSPIITSTSSGSTGIVAQVAKRRRGGASSSNSNSITARPVSSAVATAQSVASPRENPIKEETTLAPASPSTVATMASSSPVPLMPARRTLALSPAADTEHRCHVCSQVLGDSAQLQAHCKKEHEKPYVCIFRWAGCTSAFGNKNEWKRHVMTQHLMLTYWRCDDAKCDRMRRNGNAHPYGYGLGSSAMGTPTYPHAEQANSGIFNRKDLFTQHVRRMHMSEDLKALEREYFEKKQREEPAGGKKGNGKNGKGNKSKKRKRSGEADTASVEIPAGLRDWNESLKMLQQQSEIERCHLPTKMTCPQCKRIFSGSTAWNERMEHVAEHMQQAYDQNLPSWPYGGATDPTLTEWAEQESVQIVKRCYSGGGSAGVHISWELVNPLQQLAAREMSGVIKEEDGEGELEFEAY